MDRNGVSAFISIMRGCNNVCSYCVVPYTRGAERSRDPYTIVREAQILFDNGYKEVTLLGQNVDSYIWKEGEEVNFAQLLEMVAEISPELRVRFSTSHPKDISDEVIYTMAKYENICKHIHLPVQSGSSIMLEKMRRKYNREWYLERVEKIRSVIPDCGITTDVIAGFSGETEQDHQDTLSLMEKVMFDSAFMFAYSERPGTLASKKYPDDIPYEVKTSRLNEIIALQGRMSLKSNEREIGKIVTVMVEGPSKKNKEELCGRASSNKMCVFPSRGEKPGDICQVIVDSVTSATLICRRLD
jgi:tRNA-2-methylthio-N6-dimethylallyladenosine synthase